MDSLKAYTAQLFDFFGLFKPPAENWSVNCQEAKGLAPNDSFIKHGQFYFTSIFISFLSAIGVGITSLCLLILIL